MTRVHYPEDVASVAKARDHVASALSDIAEEVRERAILITSELATNAIAHAHSAFTLTLTRTHDEIHISVASGDLSAGDAVIVGLATGPEGQTRHQSILGF